MKHIYLQNVCTTFTSNSVVVCTHNRKMWYIQKQREQTVEHYFMTQSNTNIQELLQGEFTDVIPQNKSTIVRIVNKFHTEYCI